MEINVTAEVGTIFKMGKRVPWKEHIANAANLFFHTFHVIRPKRAIEKKLTKTCQSK